MLKFLAVLVVVGVVSAQYGHQKGYGHQEEYGHHEEYAEPHYSFEYAVHDPKTGDIHSQKEERKGDNTQGEYRLVEPDGSERHVQYHVQGKSGFLAEVHRQPAKYQPKYEKPYPYHR